MLAGPSVVTCFNSAEGMGVCLRGKMTEAGILPAAPAAPEAPVEAPVPATEPETPAAEVAPVEAEEPAPAVPENLIAATFGLLRAEPDGSVVIAGSGTPGTEVEVFSNGSLLGRATVETSGDWVLVPDQPLPPGGAEITLGEAGKEGRAEQSFVVAIAEDKTSEPLVVASVPGQASDILQGLDRPAIASETTELAAADPVEQPADTSAAAETPVAETATAEELPADAAAAGTEAPAPAAEPAAEPVVAEAETTVPADMPAEAATETEPAAEPAVAAVTDELPAAEPAAETVAPVTETAATEPAAPTEADVAAAPAPADVPAQTPEAPVEAAEPEAAAATDTELAAVDPGAESPDVPAIVLEGVPPTIDAIEIEGDRTFFAGGGPEGATMRLYVDDAFVADAEVEDGRWLVEAGPVLGNPSQRVRIDMLQPGTAKVASRAEVNFVVELPEPAEPTAVAQAEEPMAVASAPEAEVSTPSEPPTADQPAATEPAEAESAAVEPPAATEPVAVATPDPEQQGAEDAPAVSAAADAVTAAAPATEPQPVEPPPADAPTPEGSASEPAPVEGVATPGRESTDGEPTVPAAEPVVPTEPAPAADPVEAEAPAAEPTIAAPALEAPVAPANAAPAAVATEAPATEPPAAEAPAVDAAEPAAVEEPEVPTMVAVAVGDPNAQRFASGKAIIRRGDNLWTIARRVYGEGIRYTTIYEANTGQIRDPDRIYPGQVFDLPEGAGN